MRRIIVALFLSSVFATPAFAITRHAGRSPKVSRPVAETGKEVKTDGTPTEGAKPEEKAPVKKRSTKRTTKKSEGATETKPAETAPVVK